MSNEAKKKALELAMSHIEKKFGQGAVMTLGKHQASREISAISTGSITLDIAIGIGGVPEDESLKSMAQNLLENPP